jgi:hypothetical protein
VAAVFGLLDPPERGVVELHADHRRCDGRRFARCPHVREHRRFRGVRHLARHRPGRERRRLHEKTCDTTIDLSADPPGLVVREAVFAPGDAHCCPARRSTSVLTVDEATGWTVDSTTEQPT